MRAPIEEKQAELEAQILQVEAKSNLAQDTQNALSSLATKAVRRAMRKSFVQRKVSWH
jgi:hypothetical protein